MKRRASGALLLVTAVSAAVPLTAAPALADTSSTAMVLVLDASGSMNEPDGHGSTKIATAKSAMKTIIAQLPADLKVGLRVYGHRVPSKPDHAKACQDTELVAPVTQLNRPGLNAAVDRFSAKGETPIGTSLQKAAADLPGGSAGSIVLVSDGEDSCAPPAPCDVAKQLKASGVQLTVDTVGLKVDAAARRELTCVAEATGGSYTDVQDAAQLAGKLGDVTAKAARPRRTTTGGTAVQGATTITDAPPLSNGRSSDSIVNEEILYYAASVAPDQEVTARVTIDATTAKGKGEFVNGEMHLSWVDSEGRPRANAYQNSFAGSTAVKGVTIKAEPDATAPEDVYLQIELKSFKADVELPLIIDLKGSGTAAAAASTDPSASASPDPSAEATGTAGAAGDPTPSASTPAGTSPDLAPASGDGSGYSLLALIGTGAAAGLGGLLIGWIVGMTGRRRRSGRSGRGVTAPMPAPPAGLYGGPITSTPPPPPGNFYGGHPTPPPPPPYQQYGPQ